MARSLDVAVVGAGPCGMAAARRLHQLGLSVAVFVRPTKSRRNGWLETVRSAEVIRHAFPDLQPNAAAGFFPIANSVNWWAQEEQATPSAHGVDRQKIDAALIQSVVSMGIPMRIHDEPLRWEEISKGCGVVINAAGRHGAVARRYLTPWRQIALTNSMPAPPGLPGAWTESMPDGWLWAVNDGQRLEVTFFTDPNRQIHADDGTWRNNLARSRFGKLCDVDCFGDEVLCREVTPAAAGQVTRENMIQAGDASLARDPLTGQGLTLAISDGLAAAVAARTWLESANGRALAQAFLAQRQRDAIEHHLANLATAYALAGRDQPYWRVRAGGRPAQRLSQEWKFGTRVIFSDHWRFGRGPALVADAIVNTEQLIPSEPPASPVAWLEGKPIRQFLTEASLPSSSDELMGSWLQRGLTSSSRAPAILQWLLDQNILRADNG